MAVQVHAATHAPFFIRLKRKWPRHGGHSGGNESVPVSGRLQLDLRLKTLRQRDQGRTRLRRGHERGDGDEDQIHQQSDTRTPAEDGDAELAQGLEVNALKPHGAPSPPGRRWRSS